MVASPNDNDGLLEGTFDGGLDDYERVASREFQRRGLVTSPTRFQRVNKILLHATDYE